MDGFRPSSEQTIAADCKGAEGGRCDFIEFIIHISAVNLRAKVGNMDRKEYMKRLNEDSVPSSPNRLDPDISEASKIGDWP